MTIKDKLKSYNFWITLVSAIILLLQVFGEKFNFKIDSNFVIDVTTALCSIFVVLGIISVPKSKTTKTDIRFIEPNYQELSSQISKELAEKLDNLYNTSKKMQEPENENSGDNAEKENIDAQENTESETSDSSSVLSDESKINNLQNDLEMQDDILNSSKQQDNIF